MTVERTRPRNAICRARFVAATLLSTLLLNACGGGSGSSAPMVTSGSTDLDIRAEMTIPSSRARSTAVVRAGHFNVYVADLVASSVTTYTASGNPTAPTITDGVNAPNAVAVDSNGKIYVANSNDTVTTYNADGTRTTPTIRVHFPSLYPSGVAVDANGKIYVLNGDPGGGAGGIVTTYTPDGTRTTPTIQAGGESAGLAIDANGKIYVTNYYGGPDGEGSVTTYLPDGTPTTPTITVGINYPAGIAVAADGTIFVANTNSLGPQIRGSVTSYNADGSPTKVSLRNGIDDPAGVALDPTGNTFVVNEADARVTTYTSGGARSPLTISTRRQPSAIAIHSQP
jgi:hypothetical protein